MKTFDPADLTRTDRYKLLIGAITPRPIALVSTCSREGVSNLAPYSFFTGVGSDPMSLLFCPASLDAGDKDTLRNCLPEDEGGTGEFVVNLSIEKYARAMAASGEPLPPDESEIDACGFTVAACRIVRPPRLAESPVAFECKTRQVLRLNPTAPRGPNVVIGEVVCVWVDDHVINDRFHLDPEQLGTIGRMGGLSYCRTRERFELRPSLDALNSPPPFPEDTGPNGNTRG